MTSMTTFPMRLVRWVAALIVVGVAATGIAVWATPLLGLRAITVDGTHDPATMAAVRAAAGVSEGSPLVRVDLDAVGERVSQVPAVATASVIRQWPHTLAITVTDRSAVATTEANGQWWLVSETGVAFSPQPDRPDDLMPLRLATPGPSDPATHAALRVLVALPPSLRAQVSTIAASNAYDVTLELADGRTVRWGSGDRSTLKATVLAALLPQPGARIDVSDPTLVTVRGADHAR